MKLAAAPSKYDPRDQAQMRGAIERADALNMKANVAVDFVLLRRPDGTVGKLTVDNANALSFAPL